MVQAKFKLLLNLNLNFKQVKINLDVSQHFCSDLSSYTEILLEV